MKYIKSVMIILVLVLSGCATIFNGNNVPDEKIIWPIEIVPWKNVLHRTDTADVVIIGIVQKFDGSQLPIYSGSSGPNLFSSSRNTRTSAHVLESYLRRVRSLDDKDIMTSDGKPNPKKMAIYIVKSGNLAFKNASELFSKLEVHNYDNTVPAIFVFHKKQLISTYTYRRNPGRYGGKLMSEVKSLYKK